MIDHARIRPRRPNYCRAALELAAGGQRVFPVRPDKRPHTPNGFKDATTDEATVRGWWEQWPEAMIGTPTGDGGFVIDVDDPAALDALEAVHGPLPPTREVITPRPGRHLWFVTTTDVTNARGGLPPGIDCRGKGGYVVVPPSGNGSGAYEWRNEDLDLAPAPAWLLDLLGAGKASNGSAPPVEGQIPKAQRNTILASMGGTMRRRGFTEREIAVALLKVFEDRCEKDTTMTEADVVKIAHSISRYVPDNDAVASLDQLNALLGLDAVGKGLDQVKVYGRGTRSIVRLELDDGGWVTLDPLGAYLTAPKLTCEMAVTTGATPVLKAADVAKVAALIFSLGKHYETVEVEDRAAELAEDYLRECSIGEVDMANQQSRWSALCALNSSPRTDIVLQDVKTGVRYVRIGWFAGYVRDRGAVADSVLRSMLSLGWQKRGAEGQIKATRPGFTETKRFRFFEVDRGWGE